MELKEGLWRSMCEWFWPLITESKEQSYVVVWLCHVEA